jgi:hypothetical protein
MILCANEVAIPPDLDLEMLDWVESRPVSGSLWGVRIESRGDTWNRCEISQIEVSVRDLAAELCGELQSMGWPDPRPPGNSPQSPWWLEEASPADHASLIWRPTQSVVDALPSLNHRATVRLSEGVALLSGVPHECVIGNEDGEVATRIRSAELALFESVQNGVVMYGAPVGNRDEPVKVEISFATSPLDLERNADSLTVKMSGATLAAWSNVRLDTASLRRWLDRAISESRAPFEKELRRKHSLRIFEHPFWSLPAALCWIAFRDRFQIETRLEGVQELLRLPNRGPIIPRVEWFPEILLIAALRRGSLSTWEGQTKLESACWRQAEPVDGDIRWRDALGDGLGRTSTRQLRIRRDDLLKIFPELTVSAPQVTARRMRKVQRVERWLAKNRRWIRCHELKEWLEHPMHRDSKRPAKDPVRGFIVREFQIGSDSRLRLLTQFSSVVRFSDGPPVRPAKSTDVRKLDPYDDPVYDPSRNYFSDLWATNEACRELVKEMWLPFPAHWHTVPAAQPPEGVELGTISVDRDKAASKTAAGSPCPGKRRGPKPENVLA